MADKVQDEVGSLKTPTIEGGKIRSEESQKALAAAMVEINKSEVTQKKDLDNIAACVKCIHFIKPDTTDPAKLYGYTTADLVHTEVSYRHATCDYGSAYLTHGLGHELYEDTRDILLVLNKIKRESGGRAPIKSMVNEDGSLHENASDEFIGVWGNGEHGYHGISDAWKKFDKHMNDAMPRVAERLAKRKHIVRKDVERMISGTTCILKDQKVSEYADEKCAEYFAAKEEARKKDAAKLAKQNARTKGLARISKDITAREEQISALRHIEKEIPMQWRADSRPAIIAAYEKILEGEKALQEAFTVGRCNKAAPKKK